MIRVFKPGRMRHTPFDCEKDLNFLANHGVHMVNNIGDSDIILTARLSQLTPFRLLYGRCKKYFAWTNEPRYETYFEPIHQGSLWLSDAHVMNVYTGDVWTSNYDLSMTHPSYRNYWNCSLDVFDADSFPAFKHKKIVAIMGCKSKFNEVSLKRNGEELDLSFLRTQIALEGHHLNKVDIYGKNWPLNVALEESRDGNYQQRKAAILKSYHFNLCFENTSFPYYCTEKIWDSICYGCLPIYHSSGNKIYEDFPKNSFIDYVDFSNPTQLFEYIENITAEEFRDRMNLCIEVFNQIHEKLKIHDRYQELLFRIIQKFRMIMSDV